MAGEIWALSPFVVDDVLLLACVDPRVVTCAAVRARLRNLDRRLKPALAVVGRRRIDGARAGAQLDSQNGRLRRVKLFVQLGRKRPSLDREGVPIRAVVLNLEGDGAGGNGRWDAQRVVSEDTATNTSPCGGRPSFSVLSLAVQAPKRAMENAMKSGGRSSCYVGACIAIADDHDIRADRDDTVHRECVARLKERRAQRERRDAMRRLIDGEVTGRPE